MNKYPDFVSVLLGKGPAGLFFGLVTIAIICAIISLLIEVNNRDVNSANTPIKFSYKFMLAHNLLRIIISFLLVPITIRLTYEYIPNAWMLFVSVGIGAGADRLALLFKNIGILTTNKLASKVADKVNNT
jgi:ethanolamine transporter EutH